MSSESLKALNFKDLIERHRKNYADRLPKYSETYAREQERRQLALREYPIFITVQVAREDFPAVGATIRIGYLKSAQQGAWKQFLQDVRRELQIEFVDSIYTKKDRTPIHRISSLEEGGSYFVRLREESAVLEVLFTGRPPQQCSWPITSTINYSKEQLQTRTLALPALTDRVHRLVSQPLARPQERESSKAILAANDAPTIIKILEQVMTTVESAPETELEKEQRIFDEKKRARAMELLNKDPANIDDPVVRLLSQSSSTHRRTHDPQVDVVSLTRLGLETIQRLVVRYKRSPSRQSTIEDQVGIIITFLQKSVQSFMLEVDVVVMSLNLLNELFPLLTRHKHLALRVILEVIRNYAPPPPPNRPRDSRLLNLMGDEEMASKQAQDALRLAGLMVREDLNAQAAQQDLDLMLAKVAGKATTVTEDRRYSEDIEFQDIAPGYEPMDDAQSGPKKAHKRLWRGSAAAARYHLRSLVYLVFDCAARNPADLRDTLPDGVRRVAKAEATKGKTGDLDDDSSVVADKLVIEPLPACEGVQFRGLSDAKRKASAELGLVKGMSTLYSFLIAHPSNAEVGLRARVEEEVADIALVCQAYPRVLEYVVWIVDKLCRVAAEDEPDDWEELACSGLTDGLTGAMSKSRSKKTNRLTDAEDGGISQLDDQPPRWREVLVLALALASGTAMVDAKDRVTANGWLQRWDDGSRDYRLLCVKGLNMAGL